MKDKISWKMFWILLGVCLVTVLMALPYTLTLSATVAKIPLPILVTAQLIQSAILFSIAILVGLKLGKTTGLGLPILEKAVNGEKVTDEIKLILGNSIMWGIISALLIIGSGVMFSVSTEMIKAELMVPTWMAVLVSFYGGISEEVLLRLFLMTLLLWVTTKFSKGKVTNLGVWVAIILSSMIFGLGHLPITAAMTVITPIVVVRALVLNGIGGITFGWLYQKKGLESAIIAHFSADIVLHVLLPITLRLV